jgi:3-oxoacyl-[acyl-carrier protein] reductase
MTDVLLSLSRSTLARKFVKSSGLPIPMPQALVRQRAPWRHDTLQGMNLAVGRGEFSVLAEQNEVTRLAHRQRFTDMVEALNDAGADTSGEYNQLDGILFDASTLTTPESLKTIYEYFYNRIGKLKPCSHILIVGDAGPKLSDSAGVVQSQLSPVAAATQEALTGFVRSLSKELGSRGITANLIFACNGTNLNGVVRYFLSHHSSYVSGQVLVASEEGVSSSKFEKLLTGRTILVTGAAHGIGAAIARRAAGEGAKVLLLDRPQEISALEALGREIRGTILPVDLLGENSVSQTIKKLRELAPIHGVVHNAGITQDKMLFKMNAEKWNSVVALNLSVPLAMTELMMGKEHDFICAKDASFVFISSISGLAGNAGQTNYAATKSGVTGYVRALAKSDICGKSRFNCVAPGFIDTRMTQAMPMAVREVAKRLNSLKQGGEPDDIAQAVVFLLSDASLPVNGETLRVCGQNIVGK